MGSCCITLMSADTLFQSKTSELRVCKISGIICIKNMTYHFITENNNIYEITEKHLNMTYHIFYVIDVKI